MFEIAEVSKQQQEGTNPGLLDWESDVLTTELLRPTMSPTCPLELVVKAAIALNMAKSY